MSMFHVCIAAIDAASLGPSKIPQPWMQAYSVPERLTPWRSSTSPASFTSSLRLTLIPSGPLPVAATGAVVADAADDPEASVAVTVTSIRLRRSPASVT